MLDEKTEQQMIEELDSATNALDGSSTATPGKEATPPFPENQATKTEVKEPEQGATQEEEEIPDLKDNENPNRENWKALRDRTKREEKERKRLETELKELKNKAVPTTPPQTVSPTSIPTQTSPQIQADPVVRQPAVTIERTVEYFRKGLRGDFGDKSQEYVELSREALNEYPPHELSEMFRRAKSGYFGEESSEIAEAIKDQLIISNADWAKQQEVVRQKELAGSMRNQSIQKVLQRHPELNDENSEFTKTVKVVAENIQKTAPQLLGHPNILEILAEQAELRLKSTQFETVSKEIETLKKERDDLKTKYEKITSPEATRRSSPENSPDDMESARQEIREHERLRRDGG